jgi:ATP-dependent Lon protease
MLEVLDPAQNDSFRDHYLDMPLDLSSVLFICTANLLDTIPRPLLDRMEVIPLAGYIDEEKLHIARRFLLPRQREQAGLREDQLDLTDDGIATVIGEYTREAGVRQLERRLAAVARKIARRVAQDGDGDTAIGPDAVREHLGPERVHNEVKRRTEEAGVATGLAVTGAGGEILFVEASVMPGTGRLQVTGQLGDVMKESAQIALSYVRSNATELGVDASALDGRIHLHVPAGAIAKDGPSAGVTMTTALVSMLTDRRVKDSVGMTGELTLQGRVLPIGGVKQKVLAAHRAGLREVIIPARNRNDLDDVPDTIRDEMTFHALEDIRAVLDIALG